MKRCGVAVVQSDSVEVLRCDFSVLLHVGPQVGAVLRTLPVAQLHTVAPADQLSPQVHVRACRRCVPNNILFEVYLSENSQLKQNLQGDLRCLHIMRYNRFYFIIQYTCFDQINEILRGYKRIKERPWTTRLISCQYIVSWDLNMFYFCLILSKVFLFFLCSLCNLSHSQ